MAERTLQAFCACNYVQIRFSAESLRCINCHCGLCRRLSGAAYSTWLGVETDRFDLHTGADEVARYEATDNFHRYFCAAAERLCSQRMRVGLEYSACPWE